MATDTEMLNFLEAMGEPSGLKWIARPSVTGRGWRLHQDPQGEHETARAALEDAMTRFVYATPNVVVQGQDEAQLRTVPLERPVGRKEE